MFCEQRFLSVLHAFEHLQQQQQQQQQQPLFISRTTELTRKVAATLIEAGQA